MSVDPKVLIIDDDHALADLLVIMLGLDGFRAEAMVLAVYMPPQEPGPGIEQSSTTFSPASSRSPRACLPTASNTETISHITVMIECLHHWY